MTWERFPRAPIAEALLDIQVALHAPVDPARLQSFHDTIRDRYPGREERVKWRGEILVGPAAVQQAVAREAEG